MAKSKVVKITNPRIISSGGRINSEQIQKMVDRAMMRLTGAPDSVSAWESIAGAGDTFGIKPNCLGGERLTSSPAMAQAVVNGLKSAGVKVADIIIWERSNRELEEAGYQLNVARSDLRCFGTDSRGVGYGREFHQFEQVASLISTIFEDYIEKNINFPLLKDHSVAGISGGMKNMYGLVNNPNKYHPNNCNPYAAQISALPIVKQKNVLTICDLTRVQYDGGPAFSPGNNEELRGVMVSFDPVALDSCGYYLIDDLRKKYGLKSLKDAGREPVWLQTAAKLGLGATDPANFEFIEEELS